MPFDQSTITHAAPPAYRGGQVYLSWTGTRPAGGWYQVYLDGRLAWSGKRTWTWVPVPAGPVRVEIGAVAVGERFTDFSASLPIAPARRAELAWEGPADQSTLAAFHVFAAPAAGEPPDYTAPAAVLTAFPGGIPTYGFGLGGFGLGGWNYAAGQWSWTSGPLAGGTWQFAVAAVDTAGNVGPAWTTAVAIDAPPAEPANFTRSTARLRYTWAAPVLTLYWEPSPSF